jgi:amino acid transporter
MVLVIGVLPDPNLPGVRVSARVGNVLTVGKRVPLVLLVVIGAFFVDPVRYSFASAPGYTSFSGSVLLLVFAFSGFENAVIPAGEARDPRRDLPFALIAGTTLAMLLYLAIQAVCIGVVPDLAVSQRPLADAGGAILGAPGAFLISLGALVSVTGTMNGVMLAAPRLLFAMAEQGQLPAAVAATHPRYRTPHIAIMISAIGMLLFTLTGTFASAATLSTTIRLATYGVTCAALPVLRRRAAGGPATFTVPGGDVVAGVALLLIAWLFSSSAWPDTRAALVAGAIGLVLYARYARRERNTAPALEFD